MSRKRRIIVLPWKKNFRLLPPQLLAKAKKISGARIVVACTKALTNSDIQSGMYHHVGITWDAEKGSLAFKSRVLPLPQVGKYSDLNLHGREIKRKDWPKITKPYTQELPNFGDPTYGYHDVTIYREVYQVEFIAPRELEIQVELIEEQTVADQTTYVFTFKVDEVLDPNSEEFDKDLLYCLNLLQESVGRVDVFPSEASRQDFLKTVSVDWEILPPGQRDEVLGKIVSKLKVTSPEERKQLEQRYDMLATLKPRNWISGTSGFHRYFGARFRDDLVVFENLEYGNAAYVMYEKWETLSRRSRTELLKGDKSGFDRVIHLDGWEQKLKKLVRDRMT